MGAVTQEKTYRDALSVPPRACGDGFDAVREAAFRRFRETGLPTPAHEDWKYLSLDAALDAPYHAPCEDCLEAVDKKILELHFLSHDEKNRIVFVNGNYSPKFSAKNALPAGVVLSEFGACLGSGEAALAPHLANGIGEEANPFALVNAFSFTDGAFLSVPDGVKVEETVHVLFVSVGHGSGVLFHPRVLAVLGKDASASLAVNHVELNAENHFMNAVLEARVGDGASLEWLGAQRSDAEGTHLHAHRFYLGRDSKLDALFFTRGGALTRNEARVDFLGEGAHASLKGLTLARHASAVHHHPTANHFSPRCTSRQFYKSVVADEARTEFDSLVRVSRGALKSDSRQLSNNLLLSAGARAFARPQLRIDTDDVTCAHGATVGQLEKDELFYLRSRGLSKEFARKLLIYGFAEAVLEDLREGPLKKQLEALLEREIDVMGRERR